MFAKKIYVLGVALAVTMCMGLSSAIASDDCNRFGCRDDCEFTTEFPCEDFVIPVPMGKQNPYFILKPGWKLVLETPEGEEDRERAEVIVLDSTYTVASGVTTREVEERAYEWDDGDWKLIEISTNYFAICEKTNAVGYFGEFSQECENGFTEDEDMCEPEEGGGPTPPDTTGSWEAGVNEAEAGLIMPGTFLLGSRYFQEIAEQDEAVDRGENVAMGLTVVNDAGTFTGCVKVIDTNPAEGVCKSKDGDPKIYCPGVGMAQDEDMELVCWGLNCDVE